MLQAGMTVQPEPSACLGRHRTNIGGNLIVTENGCEELNTIPCELRFISWAGARRAFCKTLEEQ